MTEVRRSPQGPTLVRPQQAASPVEAQPPTRKFPSYAEFARMGKAPAREQTPAQVADSRTSQQELQLEATRQALREQGRVNAAEALIGNPVFIGNLMDESHQRFADVRALEQLDPEEYIVVTGGTYNADNHRGGRNNDRFGHVFTPKKFETYTVDNPDGTQTVYAQRVLRRHSNDPLEYGVFEETYSPRHGLFKREESRGLKEKKLVGMGSEMIPVINANGQEQEALVIYTEKFYERKRGIERERNRELKEALKDVQYVPTEEDRILKDAHVEQLRSLLQNTKETTGKQIVQTIKQLAVSGTASVLFWVPGIFPSPVAAAHIPLSWGIGFLGNNLINRQLNADEQTVQTMNIMGAALLGFGVGSLIPIPFGSFIGAGVGLLGVMGASKIGKMREFNSFAKAHPEITDENELKSLFAEWKAEEKGRKANTQRAAVIEMMQKTNRQKRRAQLAIAEAYNAEHSETASQIKKNLPNISTMDLMSLIEQFQDDYKKDVAGNYLREGKKNLQIRTLAPLATMAFMWFIAPHAPGVIGEAASTLIAKAPIVLSALTTAWAAIYNPWRLHKNVKNVRKAMQTNDPELYAQVGNGKN